MKILWLYRFFPEWEYDNWLHMKFVEYISQNQLHDIRAYGPRLDEKYRHLLLALYDPRHTLEELYTLFQFDVIICCTKGRMFEMYNPFKKTHKNMWLPSDFASWKKTPKIMLEEDYHYEENDEWYADMKFDLILQRHYSQSLRQQQIPMKFFPFSVDTKSFTSSTPNRTNNRKWRVAFVGNRLAPVYLHRRTAVEVLTRYGLIDDLSSLQRIHGVEYLDLLKSYIGFISCGSTMEICAAKNLEIMASGALLITNKFIGREMILPDDTHITYENSCSDLIHKVRNALAKQEDTIEIIKRGRDYVQQYHSHDIRVKELEEIVKGL